jgi:two-component system, response regulator RpfG
MTSGNNFHRSPSRIRAVPTTQNTVMVVDDQSTSRAILEQIIRSIHADASVVAFDNPLSAVAWAGKCKADLVLVDYRMPEMDGIQFVGELRNMPDYAHVPVIMVTAHDERKVRYAALDAGISDFLIKPIDPRECIARCRNLLMMRRQQLALQDKGRLLEGMVHEATQEVRQRERETLYRLARAGEYRDEETGNHVIRMARYSRLIAETIGLREQEAETLELAAPLHDIGKIGIPDGILLKPGRLDDEERREIQKHAAIGYEILKDSPSKYLRMGALIALGHHEKWNGSGYPNGYVGDHIPLPARIVAIADVFDALTSNRPYKRAWSSEDAFAFLQKEAGSHFDPELVAAFLRSKAQALLIKEELKDEAPPAAAEPVQK